MPTHSTAEIPRAHEQAASQPMGRFVPTRSVRRFVDHYWLAAESRAPHYEILPDGAVDVVLLVDGSRTAVSVYGTTTRATGVPLVPGGQYVGIRFRPGGSRHFLDASARELTDSVASASGRLSTVLEDAFASAGFDGAAKALDDALDRWIRRVDAERTTLDDVVDALALGDGTVSVATAAASLRRSPRQFERMFLDAIGLSPRAFSSVCRFQRAAAALSEWPAMPLAQVAAECGYADQSHMTRAFRQWAGRPPARFRRERVAFVQDDSTA
jgi:AraC-like DNA-binding protein